MHFATRKCIKNIYKPSVDRRSFLVRPIVYAYQYVKTSISWLAIKISWLERCVCSTLAWNKQFVTENIHYLWHFQRAHNFPIGHKVALFTKKLKPTHLWTWLSQFFSYIRSCKGIFKYVLFYVYFRHAVHSH